MEETIKVLEEFLKGNKYCEGCKEKCVDCYIEYEEVQAVATLLQAYKEDEKVIEKIKKEVREHIGFENRLKRDGKEPDLFNQGRFYVADNIRDILEIK